MKIVKDGKTLEVTEKAFNVVYKNLGYTTYAADIEDEGFQGVNSYKKDEIIDILKERGIDHNPNDKKEALYNLMIEGD